jgi:hypothetical protein
MVRAEYDWRRELEDYDSYADSGDFDYFYLVKKDKEKRNHFHFFIWELGLEKEVQEALMDAAESEDCHLEWEDVLHIIKQGQQEGIFER